MDPLGITRACTSAPSITRNARITQTHESTSRHTRSLTVSARFAGTFSTMTASPTSAATMSLHFELHQLRWVAAGVARRAKFSFRIFHSFAQRFEREIAERIGAQKLPYFLGRLVRCDQFFAPRRIHAVITGRNRRRTADAHVNFGRASFAYQSHDFTARRPAHD